METIEEWIEQLKDSHKLIIVEGKKDKEALETYGIRNIFPLNGKPLYKVIEEVADNYKDAIILTDLDKEGKKLFGNLNSNLSRFGVRVDNSFRNFLFRKTKLRQIEGLDKYHQEYPEDSS